MKPTSMNMPPTITCDNCGFTYYEVSGGAHVCNKYRKRETMQELTGSFQQGDTARYPARALAELLAAGEINREQYERLRRETTTTAEHEPAARGEGNVWEYAEDAYRRPSIRVGNVELTPHWEGLRTADEIRGTLRQIVNEHAALVEQRDRLREML